MRDTNNKIINLPNAVSLLRLLLAPVLILLAIDQQPRWFIFIVLFSGFTDVLDGFLARTLHQITRLGSHLDSWGDFAIYSSMTIGAWLLWPEIVTRERIWIILIIASFTLPVLLGLIKFHALTSYHTWSVKLAVFCTFFSYALLFSGIVTWPVYIAAAICVYAGIEEIAITVLMQHERADIRSVWQALAYHRADQQ